MRLFGYAIDLCVCSTWIIYKRDCLAMKENPMLFKNFRLDVSTSARCKKTLGSRHTRSSPSPAQPLPIPLIPRQGMRAQIPDTQQCYNNSRPHLPIYVKTARSARNAPPRNPFTVPDGFAKCAKLPSAYQRPATASGCSTSPPAQQNHCLGDPFNAFP